MLRLDILESPLNTEHAKSLLQQAFSAVELKYPTVFTPLSLPWKQRCLTAITQKCNENKKKTAQLTSKLATLILSQFPAPNNLRAAKIGRAHV